MSTTDRLTQACRAYSRKFFQSNLVAFVERRLRRKITRKQREICQALVNYKRVIVLASHSIGKSFIAACAVTWFFTCFPNSLTITTAPTARQVRDILWKEIRKVSISPEYLQPVAPRMQVNAEWYAVGMTAAKPDAFQGSHAEFIFLVYDEAVGVGADFFEAGESMLTGENAYFLAICNPTDSSSKIKELADSGDYHVINASALEHENIKAQLKGEAMPFRGAVDLLWLERAFKNWATKIPTEDAGKLDVEWPPGSGIWYRPGPIFESRVLGRFPTQTTDNIWSDGHWLSCLERQEIDENAVLEIGCDVARFGDDFTSIFARRGNVVLAHETFNGNSEPVTAGIIIRMIREHLLPKESATGIAIKIDDAPVGGGVIDILREQGYNVVAVNVQHVAFDTERYPFRRDELWFAARDRAVDGHIDLSRLSSDSLKLLKAQLLAVKYKMNGRGQRVVEKKDDLKKAKRLKRSPDDADAFNLAFAPISDPRVMHDPDAW